MARSGNPLACNGSHRQDHPRGLAGVDASSTTWNAHRGRVDERPRLATSVVERRDPHASAPSGFDRSSRAPRSCVGRGRSKCPWLRIRNQPWKSVPEPCCSRARPLLPHASSSAAPYPPSNVLDPMVRTTLVSATRDIATSASAVTPVHVPLSGSCGRKFHAPREFLENPVLLSALHVSTLVSL